MHAIALFGHYFSWHYTRAFGGIWRVYVNFLWFFFHFFSIPNLLVTFFAPFQRMEERGGRGFDPEQFASILLANTIMRLVGAIMRFFVIVAGSVVLLLTAIGGLLFFFVWLLLPCVVVGLFLSGMALLLFIV